MFFFDPLYFVFAGPALLLALYAQYKVKNTYAKYAEVATYAGRPGVDVARRLLDSLGLYHVRIERVPGDLSDHYDPSSKVLRLSDSNYDNYSVAAVAWSHTRSVMRCKMPRTTRRCGGGPGWSRSSTLAAPWATSCSSWAVHHPAARVAGGSVLQHRGHFCAGHAAGRVQRQQPRPPTPLE